MNEVATQPWQQVDPDAIDTRLLPPQIRRLIAEIGLAATVALIEDRGGAPVELPCRYPERSSLVPVIGLAAVRRLIDSPLAGKRLTLTKPDKVHWALKRAYARAHKGRKTKRELAQELRCTTRFVQYAWNDQAESPTADLFEGQA